MVKVRRPAETDALESLVRNRLSRYHGQAQGLPAEDPRVQKLWDAFNNAVIPRTQPKQRWRTKVKAALDACFHGKCGYCERIAAKTIDHHYPKTRYPERMFLWTNFLNCCRDCNAEKLDKFPVDAQRRALLLDPTVDEPLDYLVWIPLTGATGLNPDPRRHVRAQATRDLLKLDDGPLMDQRREKLNTVRYLLARVVEENPLMKETTDLLQQHLRPSEPYLGIVRQMFLRPDPDTVLLIAAAKAKLPAIDCWIRPWI